MSFRWRSGTLLLFSRYARLSYDCIRNTRKSVPSTSTHTNKSIIFQQTYDFFARSFITFLLIFIFFTIMGIDSNTAYRNLLTINHKNMLYAHFLCAFVCGWTHAPSCEWVTPLLFGCMKHTHNFFHLSFCWRAALTQWRYESELFEQKNEKKNQNQYNVSHVCIEWQTANSSKIYVCVLFCYWLIFDSIIDIG